MMVCVSKNLSVVQRDDRSDLIRGDTLQNYLQGDSTDDLDHVDICSPVDERETVMTNDDLHRR